jgi:two-component system C4-dicarboxylate transport response regulator DctD
VLLVNGTSAEKALVARELHDRSPRQARPFVAVDCAQLAPSVLGEVLFGHPADGVPAHWREESTPRGAIRDAQGGTLYVANIDALPMVLQPRFLRFLDDAHAVRVCASSDADLAALAREGRFRADLAERLLLVCFDLSHPVAV